MVVTHKSIEKKKKMPIYVKPDNPARKFMSYAEALEDNRMLREKRAKIEAYARSLDNEMRPSPAPDIPTTIEEPVIEKPVVDNTEKIRKLQAKLESEKGPGSKARKAKIRAEIEKLEGESL